MFNILIWIAMTRIIFCQYLQQEAEGLNFPLYPGDLGKRIYMNISKEAWSRWIRLQTMLINEKKLNMTDPTHRKLLEEEMVKFLFEHADIKVDGYTPPPLNT